MFGLGRRKRLWEFIREIDYDISQQLLQLVRQAHLGREFCTKWDIQVSDEMRTALRAPLTLEQMRTIDGQEAGRFGISVSGYVLSAKMEDCELSGTVCVSIDIADRAGICSCRYENVKLRITVIRVGKPLDPDGKWVVSSAEPM